MESSTKPRFGLGDRVKLRDDSPPGHHRTPWYIKGKVGRVDALCVAYADPETRAYGGSGLPRQPLYRVEFKQAHIWDSYSGPPEDAICVDVYDHWLQRA